MIFHSVTAPGYPATNGLVERYVGEDQEYERDFANTIGQIFADEQDYAHCFRNITLPITYEQRD